MGKLKGLFTGVVLGGIAGILFAPKKGKELRKNIKKDLDDGNYGLNVLKGAFVSMGKDVGNFTSEVAKHEDVKEYLEKGKKSAKDVQDRATLWLEANYGITREDVEEVKSQLKDKSKKAKTKAKKTIKKAEKVAKKAVKKARK
ncbi:YtxH domain-containing protein [Candidatus Peregrinibacteria bacterium]|nr:YtxH domain-containing protein [Candidatus Peregrinibacteria bacterium]MBT4055797.1 YtxH domain-containing protein [Candidatus Peregrinibacteria bacterium]